MAEHSSIEGLHEASGRLVSLLQADDIKCVLAESCTGGMVAAAMAGVPGVSALFCGSQVTYREDSKSSWLGVDPALIAQHSAESEEVSGAMVTGLLARTPEADVAAAVTGHLGPGAPAEKDGVVFVAIVKRGEDSAKVTVHKLVSESRVKRQIEAAGVVLEDLARLVGDKK